jgi:hypothetical protein
MSWEGRATPELSMHAVAETPGCSLLIFCASLPVPPRCVGGIGLSVVCRMFAEDYGGSRGGLPDLLLWRPATRDAKLSEVKGPRDRLSDSQRAWMAALAAADVKVEVLRVEEPPVQRSTSGRGGWGRGGGGAGSGGSRRRG